MGKCIILLGYMCVGKTTVGLPLAKKLHRRFYDLDWYIEMRYRKRVPEIFAQHGEEHFRILEQRMLHEAAEFENTILACGGGTPCFFDNIQYMNDVGETFYLKASVETICAHLAISRGERPILKGMTQEQRYDFIQQQLAQREPFYEQAQHVVDVNVLDSFEKINIVVDNICQIRQQAQRAES